MYTLPRQFPEWFPLTFKTSPPSQFQFAGTTRNTARHRLLTSPDFSWCRGRRRCPSAPALLPDIAPVPSLGDDENSARSSTRGGTGWLVQQ